MTQPSQFKLPPCPDWCTDHMTGHDGGGIDHLLDVALIEDWPSSQRGLNSTTIEVRVSMFESVELKDRYIDRDRPVIDILEMTLPDDDVQWAQHLHVTTSEKARELANALLAAADAFDRIVTSEPG